MDWIKLIIGLIVVAAWIAGNIKEYQKKRAGAVPPPLPPSENPDEGPSDRAVTDLQTFLDDIRKRMGDESSTAESPTLTAPPPQAVAPPVAPPPIAVTPIDSPVEPLRRRKKRKPIPAETPLAVAPLPASPLSSPIAANPPILASLKSLDSGRRSNAFAIDAAVKTLNSPNGLAQAFVLREILAPPLCKRSRSQAR